MGAIALDQDLLQIVCDPKPAFDPPINEIKSINSPNRVGDIPHSLASIEKAKRLLNYNPQYSLSNGLKEAAKWYWENLK